MPSLSASSLACTPRRARAPGPLTAVWIAALLSLACRDTREDTNYCRTCTGAETAEGSSTDGQERSSPPASSGDASTSQTGGVKTGPASMMSMVNPAGAGRNAQAANTAAASGGASALPMAGMRATQAGSAARSGNGGRSAEPGAANGGSGPSAPRDAGMNGPEPTPDAGTPTPVPCNGPCPNNVPVCDESMPVPSCVQCTTGDQAACTGATSTCDVAQHKCVQCTPDDARDCKGDTQVCNRDNRCVACTNEQPESCPSAQPICVDEQRCVECRSNADCRTSDRNMCNAEGKCVTCLNDAQCPDPAQPRCDTETNGCVGCEGASDCNGRFPQTPYCDKPTKACVACTPDGESQCSAGQYCEPNAHACAPGTPRRRNCEQCSSDQDCAQAPSIAACIEHDNGRFCFAASPSATSLCEPGYMPASEPSRPQVLYCMPIAPTTCQTITSAISEKMCINPGDCGNSGNCQTPPGICKLSCSSPQHCPAPLICDQTMRLCTKKLD